MRRRALLAAAAGGVGLAAVPFPAATDRAASRAPAVDAGDATVAHADTTTPPAGTGTGPPVVDNAGDPDETITVDVRVVDEAGDPAEGVAVELEDRGGTPDDRVGETGAAGRIRFLESVGPPPCNTLTVKLPDHGLAANLGCNDGGAELAHTFTLGPGRTPTTASETEAATPAASNEAEAATPATATDPESTTPVADNVGPRTSTASREATSAGDWLAGWELLASWFVGVSLAGPLALGALVALVDRYRAEDADD